MPWPASLVSTQHRNPGSSWRGRRTRPTTSEWWHPRFRQLNQNCPTFFPLLSSNESLVAEQNNSFYRAITNLFFVLEKHPHRCILQNATENGIKPIVQWCVLAVAIVVFDRAGECSCCLENDSAKSVRSRLSIPLSVWGKLQ